MKVLSTKMLDAQTLEFATSLGLEVDCVDVIETRPLKFDINVLNKTFDAVVFTSANAVNYFLKIEGTKSYLTDKTIFCTSGKTKGQLIEYGFNKVQAAKDSAALADMINKEAGIQSVLHVCGDLRLGTLEKKLKEAGKVYEAVVVYETRVDNSAGFDNSYEVVMFYSPSGVKAYGTSNAFHKNCVYCCIGETTAEAVKSKASGLKVIIPLQPKPEAMLETIAAYFKKSVLK